jgi:peptidoglycan/LPS O-acetylase OafA/YrhL
MTPVRIRDGHDNFFTPLRILMALLVVIDHAMIVGLRDMSGGIHGFFHYDLSYLAVNLFFITSGFLVTKSMTYRRDLAEYSSARVLRIYPALIVHLAFIVLLIGPLATTLPIWDYLTHPDVWKQPFLVLSFFNSDMVLPGAFLTNHEQLAGAPLWTLRYELMAYLGTALIFSLGLMRRKWMILAQFIVPSLAWIVTKETGLYEHLPATAQSVLRFGIAYGLGATLFAYRKRLNFHLPGLLCMALLAVLCSQISAMEIAVNLMLAYGLMLVAFVKAPRFNRLQDLSDVSYGIYIYHWGLLQLAFYWWPQLSPIALFVLIAPLSYAIAYASWHIVEKPALKAKKQFAKHLRFGRKPPSLENGKILLD